MTSIEAVYTKQVDFFKAGNTLSIETRLGYLQNLRRVILENIDEISAALKSDLGKCAFESLSHEVIGVISEIDYCLKKTKSFSKGRRTWDSLIVFPSVSKLVPHPKGTVLVIAPWNYPLLLTIRPIISAIAAGNTVMFKPSEYTPHVSRVLIDIVSKVFPQELCAGFDGGPEVSTKLLSLKFGHVFFTGSTEVGKIIYAAAAKHLSPVTLELGGKSPTIIGPDVDIHTVAKKIAWGKTINSGQTCVAPDYVLVHESLKERFVSSFGHWISVFYGDDPVKSQDYSSIVSDRHADRLAQLLNGQKIILGGKREGKRIEPTLVDEPSLESPIMTEEIFGPLLPVLGWKEKEEILEIISKNPNPLAFYIFTKDRSFSKELLSRVASGGAMINDLVIHLSQHHLPFGGVGESGMGRYHGWFGLETFSHMRAEVERPSSKLFDLPMRYPPYKSWKGAIVKKLFGIKS